MNSSLLSVDPRQFGSALSILPSVCGALGAELFNHVRAVGVEEAAQLDPARMGPGVVEWRERMVCLLRQPADRYGGEWTERSP
jgi:hypothetical protein